MNAVAKTQIQSHLIDRFGHIFERHEKSLEIVPTGIGEIDQALGGFPRGAITEIYGAASCGRTSLMLSTLATASANEETCALIDCSDTFDVFSAARAEISFDRLLWVRCNHNLESAFKATDLLLHGGGFGLVVLNLADVPPKTLRRIISTWWFRFRRAIENTPTVLLVTTSIACLRSSAAMVLEVENEDVVWPSADWSARDDHKQPAAMRKERPQLHLSLVVNPSWSSPITHAHLLQSSSIRVHRERPLISSDAINFSCHS